MISLVYLLSAAVGLFSFHVPIHREFMIAVAIATAILTLRLRLDVMSDRGPSDLVLQLAAIMLIIWSSDGSHSPVRGLFLLFILQCGIRFGGVAGLTGGLIASVCLGICDQALPHEAHAAVGRALGVSPFYALIGYVTGVLTDSRAHFERNEERRQREMATAREVQEALLPDRLQQIDGWKMEWRLKPHREVGGDLVSILQGEESTRCMIADVCGKGMAAALFVGIVQSLFYRTGHLPLAVATREMNRHLFASGPNPVGVSLIMVELHSRSGRLAYCNAGHPYPLVWRHTRQTLEQWSSNDIVCGWLQDVDYHTVEAVLEPGDHLLIYTDGVSDARVDRGLHLGEMGIMDTLRQISDGSLQSIADTLLTQALAGQTDDITLVLLEPESTST